MPGITPLITDGRDHLVASIHGRLTAAEARTVTASIIARPAKPVNRNYLWLQVFTVTSGREWPVIEARKAGKGETQSHSKHCSDRLWPAPREPDHPVTVSPAGPGEP